MNYKSNHTDKLLPSMVVLQKFLLFILVFMHRVQNLDTMVVES